jgi:hypothetical protein
VGIVSIPGPSYYRAKEPAEILQGDIFDLQPSIFIQSRPLSVVRMKQAADGRIYAGMHTEDGKPTEPEDGYRWDKAETIVCDGILSRAVMLTHDCEIEKDDKHRVLALIRPWATIPTEHQDAIRQGHRYRFFWLPEQNDPDFPESYVDFRRLTTVRPQALDEERRRLSMTERMREALGFAFIKFITRKDVA